MQRAAIQALANFDGPEAAAILRQHINPGNLALRYEYVQALVEKLHQPMEAEWLRPVLMGREQNDAWLDSLRLLYLYGGKPAIPVMLSCLDYDVAWSDRNWWILDNGVKPCPNAPPIDYEYRLDSDGSPQQWQKNLRLLQTLKPQADMIPPPSTLPPIAPVPLLITDPPINFTPSFREVEHGGVEIKSGFLCLTLGRGIADMPYSESDFYRPLYEKSGRFRSLAGDASQRAKLKITGQQSKQLEDLLHQFAVRLCGARVSDQKTGNLYNLLVWQSGYCPFSADWSDLFRDYQEAPPWLKEQAKADLIESVRVFSQNYHAGTADFVESASKIFTSAQLEQILK
jgi:hypothetical protein